MLDVERVMQVFENLVANAARFAAARVEASVEWDGSRLALSVSGRRARLYAGGAQARRRALLPGRRLQTRRGTWGWG